MPTSRNPSKDSFQSDPSGHGGGMRITFKVFALSMPLLKAYDAVCYI